MTRSLIKALSGAFLALALFACATAPSITNPISQSAVYNLENGYGVAQSLAVAYTRLRRCTVTMTLPCSTHTTIVALATADHKARAALSAAETFVRNNPTLSAASVISAAQAALSAFTQIESSAGIH